MSSRTLPPFRAASRCLRQAQQAPYSASLSRRSVVTTTKPRFYAQATTTTSSTATKPSTSTTTSTTAPKAATTTTTAPRTPLPATSGEALPDAGATPQNANDDVIDWTQSFHGLGESTFGPEVATILQQPLNPDDIEVKPDGIIYLPEIKYRRILNAAFGPGGWGLAPRGQLIVHEKLVTREYALIVHGR